MSKTYVTTFQLDMPTAATLAYFQRMSHLRAGSAPAKQMHCTDGVRLREWITYLRALPDRGDQMKKPGDVALLTVELFYPAGVFYVSFYDRHLKTTDTSFYAESPLAERQLYDSLVEALGGVNRKNQRPAP
ncbi:MAG: hypothetical protein MUC38_02920 [Cyclobacteriaceae bacterium]|jgi:hypothetical protein|nr:hypothetical protein [Cyclobacteriaceae bacterium]